MKVVFITLYLSAVVVMLGESGFSDERINNVASAVKSEIADVLSMFKKQTFYSRK